MRRRIKLTVVLKYFKTLSRYPCGGTAKYSENFSQNNVASTTKCGTH
jgi:hypothetical protein